MQTRAEQIESLKNALMKVKDQLIEAGYKVDFEALERYKQQITPYYFKEPKMSTFKVGDRVRINWPNDDTGRFHGQVGVITKPNSSGQSWWVNLDTGHHDHWGPDTLELVKPQFKKGDKLLAEPVNCAICNKEYTAINDVGDIIGGCVLDGPVKIDGRQNEEMVIGPCCYPRIMDTIMDLKTKTNVTTTRENATNSWMPHDEDGNL